MRRAARALALLVLAVVSAAALEVRFSKHARQRMKERGVTMSQVRRIVETAPGFKYTHAGRRKTGYYDKPAKIFVATDEGLVITVVTRVNPAYVESLKKKK